MTLDESYSDGPRVSPPLAAARIALSSPSFRQVGQVTEIRVPLENVTDVHCHGVLIVHGSTVEELPITVLVMDYEQNRQFAPVYRAA